MQPFTYTRASTTADAVHALAAGGPGTRFLAVGTTLYDLWKLNVDTPTSLVDIAPTIASFLGLSTEGFDGSPLALD